MRPLDDPPGAAHRDERDRLQHELNTPLTTIWGRAQLLQRHIERAAGLTTGERAMMLAELAIMSTAVRVLTARIAALGHHRPAGHDVDDPGSADAS
jgi:signal transduction histidine kinase